ncbi:dirigent protein 22-like [Nicotiana tomentosiformis]|uniref:Dirigent protein n=1 Tax=Nicotiana tabacum TaxID=4097 RepID=A0A1S4C7J0_TOBAC|nr:dirigent protein 22-like [Nicotiana tomentosiformis]XP_016497222.1 PREDICTED: dirigent protein 22-like [Nicotiana tabacum]
MEKLLLMVCLLMAITMPSTHGLDRSPKGVDKWFKKLPNAKEKMTKLHFYFHDTVTAKNPSAIQIAQANITFQSPTLFGLLRMFDNSMTVQPDPNSKEIGRAQGIYGSASFQDIELLMTLNLVFTEGKYNGSTLSILGHNRIFHEYRELPIVGGSGVFRLARGIATAKTYWASNTTQNAIVEYHVVVLHY